MSDLTPEKSETGEQKEDEPSDDSQGTSHPQLQQEAPAAEDDGAKCETEGAKSEKEEAVECGTSTRDLPQAERYSEWASFGYNGKRERSLSPVTSRRRRRTGSLPPEHRYAKAEIKEQGTELVRKPHMQLMHGKRGRSLSPSKTHLAHHSTWESFFDRHIVSSVHADAGAAAGRQGTSEEREQQSTTGRSSSPEKERYPEWAYMERPPREEEEAGEEEVEEEYLTEIGFQGDEQEITPESEEEEGQIEGRKTPRQVESAGSLSPNDTSTGRRKQKSKSPRKSMREAQSAHVSRRPSYQYRQDTLGNSTSREGIGEGPSTEGYSTSFQHTAEIGPAPVEQEDHTGQCYSGPSGTQHHQRERSADKPVGSISQFNVQEQRSLSSLEYREETEEASTSSRAERPSRKGKKRSAGSSRRRDRDVDKYYLQLIGTLQKSVAGGAKVVLSLHPDISPEYVYKTIVARKVTSGLEVVQMISKELMAATENSSSEEDD